jgi:hypothetical protein
LTTTETQPVETEVGQVPSIRSDTVCTYLINMATVLSSIVVDLNAQVASIRRLTQTNSQEENSNDNSKL